MFFFDWWFSPKELWGYWLVHIDVPPMGLQNPSAPWVLSLVPSLGTLCSIQWMILSIHFCIYQALAKPHRRQLYSGSFQQNLASVCNSVCIWWMIMGRTPRWGSLWMVRSTVSALNFVSVTPSMGILFLRRNLSFWTNIHLSVSAYHVCSYVIGLPHSG